MSIGIGKIFSRSKDSILLIKYIDLYTTSWYDIIDLQ
jgi:hypothetical protein